MLGVFSSSFSGKCHLPFFLHSFLSYLYDSYIRFPFFHSVGIKFRHRLFRAAPSLISPEIILPLAGKEFYSGSMSVVRNVIPALYQRPLRRIPSGIYTPCASRLLSISYQLRTNYVSASYLRPRIPQTYPEYTPRIKS